ncbi:MULTISPECIES: RNA-binding S4 domain-containing protein [unclassified Arthrobacter]|uniref:RNA-binding S4 domain-containing protein n=1 Tax=unclassified Arthrobacter TaxID=235627 RepID=UPI001E469ACB|nr:MULTISPECIES: RNA-binding S4 domain-containing protein [unclassified Arthrobacter]MCC9146208.1 RNA-binding S4 domain-containing protein [Arthrobacter sp. zg-Y919]MDK1277438.1 RNA-binding S4 domain-containing protein [Arthrobacter sp. zg.Y919]MDM7990424.1 RNA-binding S4 domain-containing protein [Arthrobacter sp. zg-Y877]WIB03931.1 RNA-binding S4 domain-containing protein [Arthrobacter sp. zg-Y919]
MSSPNPQDLPIRDEMIRLGQLLKLANLAEDGIEAKQLIEDGMVKVNGDIEERRGRQLHAGDVVSVNGETLRITREG